MSRQKEEVLSQESRDELKDAVLQLVSYHYDNTVAVSEVWNYIMYPRVPKLRHNKQKTSCVSLLFIFCGF